MSPITDLTDDMIEGPSITEVLSSEAPPPGRALAMTGDDLTKLSALHFAPITARRCEVERTQATILRDIREAAAMSSNDFYYSFPVKKRGGGVDYIEGISVDGAMACVTAYRNAEVDCRPVDIGHSWVFLGRFIDHERGVSVIRPFLQRKVGGSQLGGVDEGRRIEIAFNIGASKATRNVVANAIRPYTNFCFEESKQDLVKRVGLKLPETKAKTLLRLEELGIDLKRVEAQFGRAASEWTAREVAGLITQIKSVQQGLATPDMIWPGEAPPEPRRSDAPAAGHPAPGPAAEPGSAPSTAAPSSATAAAADTAPQTSESPPPAARNNWGLPADLVGQEAVLKALGELLDMTANEAEVDALLAANAPRLAKITGSKRAVWNDDVRKRREQLKHSPTHGEQEASQ